MMDWEQWFRSAADAPSNTEDSKRDRTEKQIRDALAGSKALQGRPYRVYAKGSYANNTNVRLDYDVDISVQYEGYFYYDLSFDLKDKPKETVGIVDSTDSYTRDEFKADIKAALESAFGTTAIEIGNIAYRVREEKTTLPADVVPCWNYRRYDGVTASGAHIFNLGSRIYTLKGESIDNFPDQQLDNGVAKNVRTNYRYKYIVRAIKKLHTYLDDKTLITTPLPSYLVECLVYNVPDDKFGNARYLDDVRSVLAAIFNETLSTGSSKDWVEVNELKYLFRTSQPWTSAQVHQFADAAWNEIGFDA